MISEWLSELRLRLRMLRRRGQLDRDLEDEMQFHLAMREASGGNAPKRFGNATAIKETIRGQWTFPVLESIWADLRYGVRVLGKNPLFTAVAVGSLALGIGANTAVFTLIDAVMLEKLPVPAPDELVILNWWAPRGRVSGIEQDNSFGVTDPETGQRWRNVFPYAAFERFQARSRQLASVFAFTPMRRTAIGTRAGTDLVAGLLVSGSYFQGLGARPLLGRLLNDADDQPGAEPAAVLSYELWQKGFGGDPSIVGQTTTVNGVPVAMVGVTEPSFYGTSAGGDVPVAEVTMTLASTPEVAPDMGDRALFLDGHRWWLNVMGRMRVDSTLKSVRTELTGLFAQTLEETGVETEALELRAAPGARGIDSLRAMFAGPLRILMVTAGLVLLIACTNVATLLLSRAKARQGEITLRLAMGASRLRLMRQLLTESLLLSLTAGLVGAVISHWGCRALLAWLSPESLRLSLAPGNTVLGFTMGLSVLAGTLFGLAPAVRASQVCLAPALKDAEAAGSGSRVHGGRLGQGFIVLQVALSLVLVVGAGLFLQTLDNLRHVNLGFRSDGLLLFSVDPTLAGYEGDRLLSFYHELLSRLEDTPGVISVSASRRRLITGGMSNGPAYVPEATWIEGGHVVVHVHQIAPRYFETMGIPLLLGRGPRMRDTADAPSVVFINQAMAREVFPGISALGRTIRLWSEDQPPAEVAGVVADAIYTDVRLKPPPTVYVPYEQSQGLREMNLVIRTEGPPEAFAGTVRAVVAQMDPSLPLSDVATQRRVIDDWLRNERLFANLSTAFGLLALLLASIGIYGVVAYAVARRTGEFGIRIALGARSGTIVWLVLRRTVLLVLVGIAAGGAAAYWLTRFVAGTLYGVEASDPVTFAAGAALLIAVAIGAGLFPARRAARIDPMQALRSE